MTKDEARDWVIENCSMEPDPNLTLEQIAEGLPEDAKRRFFTAIGYEKEETNE